MENIINFFNNLFNKKPIQNKDIFALGAIPNEPDNRDIRYEEVVGLADLSYPSKITVPNFLETQRLMQGNLGTCVEHAFEFIKRVEDGIFHSRRIPYCITRNEMGWAENDPQGLPQREAAKVASIVGTPKDKGFDNNSLSHKLYASLFITQEMRDEANIYRFGGFSFPDITENGIKQALANGKLVAVTIAIDWSQIDADGTVHPVKNQCAGYHEVVIGQSDDLTGKFRCANWWSIGDLYLQYDEIENIIVDAIVFDDIPEDLILRAKQTPFIFTKTMKLGDNSNSVLQLQKTLALFDLYNSSFDRNFGKKTLQAVKDYQRIKGLCVDGIVGPKTRELLNN